METNEHKIIFDHAIDLEKIAASGQCFRWKKLGDGCFGIPSAGAYTRARQINPFVIAITDTTYAACQGIRTTQLGRTRPASSGTWSDSRGKKKAKRARASAV